MKEPDVETNLDADVEQTRRVRGGLAFGLALSAAAVGSVVLFRFLNRVKVEGTENIPETRENLLYCLNHTSILDNFCFGSAVYFPKMVFDPQYIPINLADRKNFFGDPNSRRLKDRILRVLGRHFFRHLRAFPVDRKAHDMSQVEHWVQLLRDNIVVVFPEGTRSRSGDIGHGKAGVGKMIYEARPTVVPVRIVGMSRILGVGRYIPRAFQTVRIFIGKPLDVSAWIDRPLPAEPEAEMGLYREIAETVVGAIRAIAPDIPEPAEEG